MVRNRTLSVVGGGAEAAPALDEDARVDDLLLRVGRGDRAAFEQLHDTVAGAVFGIAVRVVRNPALAEEIAQEALVQIWRTAPRYDPARGRARTWCLTIAHRRAVDRVRSEEAGRRREDVVSAGHQPGDALDDTGDEVIDSLDRERVARAMNGLTDVQREAVGLAFYEGRTHREVAALLDVPLGTVKTRIRDGLIRLRDELGVTA